MKRAGRGRVAGRWLLAGLLLLWLPSALRAQPAAAPPASPAPAVAAPSAAPAPEPAWLPRQVAELQGLDKVDATRTEISIAVGASARLGTLTITVRACLVRPPDRRRDAAAYLDITDKNPAIPPFHGWLLEAEPGASVFEHPIYDVRLSSCR